MFKRTNLLTGSHIVSPNNVFWRRSVACFKARAKRHSLSHRGRASPGGRRKAGVLDQRFKGQNRKQLLRNPRSTAILSQ